MNENLKEKNDSVAASLAENLNSVSSTEGGNTDFDPISAINDIKQNTVSKTEYERVKAEKDKYLKALIEGSQVADEKKEPVDIAKLKEKFGNRDVPMTDLEYWQTSLALHESTLEQEGWNDYAQFNKTVPPTEDALKNADKLYKKMKEMVDEADGNAQVFKNLYQQRVIDNVPLRKR